MNSSEQILDQFRESDALLEGHFILSSGLHSPQYLQCALGLQYPSDAAKFARAIAEKLAAEQFDTVASPAIGGLVIGYETARALNLRFIWTERENGVMTLRRAKSRTSTLPRLTRVRVPSQRSSTVYDVPRTVAAL